MKSSFDILNALYKLLNVSDVTSDITGKIYKGVVPKTSQLEDIEINVLTNPNGYLQDGYANVNLYCIEDASGRVNTKRLSEITNIVTPLVDDVEKEGFYFQIDNQGGIFKDQDRDKMYFFNLKLNYQTL